MPGIVSQSLSPRSNWPLLHLSLVPSGASRREQFVNGHDQYTVAVTRNNVCWIA